MIKISKEEFRKEVIIPAILKLNIPIKNLTVKANLRDGFYEPKYSIIMFQIPETNKYIVRCMTEKEFEHFTQTHFHSWWVLREGEFSTISPLSHLIHDNTLDALGY